MPSLLQPTLDDAIDSVDIALRVSNLSKTYRIYDITGRLVLEGKNTGGIVSINALPVGVYIIKLQHDAQVLMAKFIKE